MTEVEKLDRMQNPKTLADYGLSVDLEKLATENPELLFARLGDLITAPEVLMLRGLAGKP